MNHDGVVRLRLHGHLRALAGQPEFQFDARPGENVSQLLGRCQVDVAGLHDAIVDGHGKLVGAVVVAVNGEILPPDEFETRALDGGESVDIIPELTGG